MSSHRSPAEVRSSVKHPIIDADGHWIEYGPVFAERMRKVAGDKAADGFIASQQRIGDAPLGGQIAVGGLVACDLAHALGEDRVVFHPVAVTVDDGMLYAGPNFRRAAMRTHAGLLELSIRQIARKR